jgi:hypothetical protein
LALKEVNPEEKCCIEELHYDIVVMTYKLFSAQNSAAEFGEISERDSEATRLLLQREEPIAN